MRRKNIVVHVYARVCNQSVHWQQFEILHVRFSSVFRLRQENRDVSETCKVRLRTMLEFSIAWLHLHPACCYPIALLLCLQTLNVCSLLAEARFEASQRRRGLDESKIQQAWSCVTDVRGVPIKLEILLSANSYLIR